VAGGALGRVVVVTAGLGRAVVVVTTDRRRVVVVGAAVVEVSSTGASSMACRAHASDDRLARSTAAWSSATVGAGASAAAEAVTFVRVGCERARVKPATGMATSAAQSTAPTRRLRAAS
jgi:cytochrome c1